MKTLAILFLVLVAPSAQAETCVSRPHALSGDGGYGVKIITRDMEDSFIVVPLNAEVKQELASAEKEKAKICLEGTRTDNYFYAYGAQKK